MFYNLKILLALSCALAFGPTSLISECKRGNLQELVVERLTKGEPQEYLCVFGDGRVIRNNTIIDSNSFHRALALPENKPKLQKFFDIYKGETKAIEEIQDLVGKMQEKGARCVLISGASPGFFQGLPEILQSIEALGYDFNIGEKEPLAQDFHAKSPFKCGDVFILNGSINCTEVFKYLCDTSKEMGLKGVLYVENQEVFLNRFAEIAETSGVKLLGLDYQKFPVSTQRSPEIEEKLKEFGVKIP